MNIKYNLPLNKTTLFQLWKTMFFYREIEKAISKNYYKGHMRCPTHLSIGQELVPAIISLIKKKKDCAVSSHRGHLHFLSFGGKPYEMISEIYGLPSGCSKGFGGSMHLADKKNGFLGTSAIVGNSIPVGIGAALANKIDNKPYVTFIFIGDGATEEGVFSEAINFCSLKKLNVIFVCENNLYSVYSNLEVRRPNNFSITNSVKAYGLYSKKIKYSKIDETYNKLNYAYKLARKGKPCLIEIETYRFLEHCGPNYDNDLEYRSNKEFEKYMKNDPLKKLKKL